MGDVTSRGFSVHRKIRYIPFDCSNIKFNVKMTIISFHHDVIYDKGTIFNVTLVLNI